MSNIIETITAEFTDAREALRADYIASVKFQWNRFFNEDGTRKDKLPTMYDRSYQSLQLVRRFYANESDPRNNVYVLNTERLEQVAGEYADATFAVWVQKIAEKIGEKATDINVRYVTNNGRYVIEATIDGIAVSLEQQKVIGTSSKGTLYHQFPARLYIDGKFTSAKKFTARFYG